KFGIRNPESGIRSDSAGPMILGFGFRVLDFRLRISDIRFGISISWLVVFFRGGRFGDFIKQLGYFFLFLAERIELALFAVVEFSRLGMLLAEGFRTFVDLLLKRTEDFQ